MLALWSYSQLALAGALIATGRAEEAKPHFAAAIDISKDANFDKWVAVTQGTETGDYAAAISALRSPEFQIPEEPRSEEHTSELQSLMRISYAVFCLKKKNINKYKKNTTTHIPTRTKK